MTRTIPPAIRQLFRSATIGLIREQGSAYFILLRWASPNAYGFATTGKSI